MSELPAPRVTIPRTAFSTSDLLNRYRRPPRWERRSSRSTPQRVAVATDRWHRAVAMADEWLDYGLLAQPADRAAAEAAVTSLYRLAGHGPPRFSWVDSPGALAAVAGRRLLRLRGAEMPSQLAGWPVATQLAMLASDLMAGLDAIVDQWRSRVPWQSPLRGPPDGRAESAEEILSSGALLEDLLDGTVLDGLWGFLRGSLWSFLRDAVRAGPGWPSGLIWYGQHDIPWIARLDIWQRLGLIRVPPGWAGQLALWAALARSGSWWWPQDRLCVMSERPAALHADQPPGGRSRWFRLHRADGPAVVYPDGWGAYAWHGTHVPGWVITNPDPRRIAQEANVEVRRCAIENLGWERYLREGGSRLVGSAPDPGNPGGDLLLYDLPGPVDQPSRRMLLAVNGSAEPDGQRRRYGLGVPGDIEDPVAAAGWSYGLSGQQYAQLMRRT